MFSLFFLLLGHLGYCQDQLRCFLKYCPRIGFMCCFLFCFVFSSKSQLLKELLKNFQALVLFEVSTK